MNSRLYWNNQLGGTIRSVGTDGNGLATAAMGEAQPVALAVDGQAVYWANMNGPALRIFRFTNQNPSDLVMATNAAGVSSNGQTLFYTTSSGSVVGGFNLMTGGGNTIYTAMGKTFGPIIFAGNRLVFSEIDGMGNGHVVSINPDGTNPQVVAPVFAGYLAFDTARGDVYFSDTQGGTVWFLDAQMGSMAVLVAMGMDQPAGVAVDDMYLYWINYGDGALYRTPLRNGDPTATTAINGGQVTAGGLVSNANYLYWTVRGNQMGTGSVMRMLKP
jgi:hypothetical protein